MSLSERKHIHFWIETPEGMHVRILGDPNMPEETKRALGQMLDAALKDINDRTKISPASSPQPKGRKVSEPYFIEVFNNGCSHCGSGRMWAIVGPDGAATGQLWGNKEEAAYICKLLNEAHANALLAERSKKP